VDSLLALPASDIPNAFARFAFSTLENTFWRPDWWEGLTEDLKQSVVERINYGTSPMTRVMPRDLTNDGRQFVDWAVVGTRSVR